MIGASRPLCRHGRELVFQAMRCLGGVVAVVIAALGLIGCELIMSFDPEGMTTCAWRLMSSQIYFTPLDAQGLPTGAGQKAVAGGSSGAWNPSLAWDGKRYGLAWEDGRDGHLEVYFKLLDPAGRIISTALRVSEAGRRSTVTPQAYSPKLALGPTGEFGLASISNKSYTDSQNILQKKKEIYFARVQCP